MPINVLVYNKTGIFSGEKELVIEEDPSHWSIHLITYRATRIKGIPILKRIDAQNIVTIWGNELPILLEELKIYRDQLDTNTEELEEPVLREWEKQYSQIIERERAFLKITDEERETINRLIKVVEDNIGKPGSRIIFDYIN